jgi:tRNA(fMet)-specific endonuclease VapC
MSDIDSRLFLLDTDTLSNMIRSVRLRRFEGASPGCGPPSYGQALRRINSLVAEFRILPFDDEAARTFGPVAALLQRSGRRIGDADTRIAAIALAHDLTVVTGNVRHFSRVAGLRVENWL